MGGGELAKDRHSPCEPPELIRIRERNTSTDAQVFRGELLEEIAYGPDKPAQELPEENAGI